MYKKIIFAGIVILALGFAYYAISPLFKNTLLDEPAPVVVTQEISESGTSSTLTLVRTLSETPILEKATQKENAPNVESFSVVKDTPTHPASGIVKIITSGNTRTVRYENFKTINGPDLYVYLSKDLNAKDFINLGKIKATEGNINYEVPQGVNIQDYSYVVVWCKAFGVLFNSTDISKLTK